MADETSNGLVVFTWLDTLETCVNPGLFIPYLHALLPNLLQLMEKAKMLTAGSVLPRSTNRSIKQGFPRQYSYFGPSGRRLCWDNLSRSKEMILILHQDRGDVGILRSELPSCVHSRVMRCDTAGKCRRSEEMGNVGSEKPQP